MKTVFILLTTFILASCHCEKKVPAKTADNSNVQPPSADEAAVLNNLAVSFYSKGGGADHKAALMFENFISEYAEKSKTFIPWKKVAWGKEGEVDYCLELSGWGDDSRNKFIAGVRESLNGVQVHIRENHPCRDIK